MRILLLFCFAHFLFADQVTLKNGDRVTGKVVKKDGPKLVMKSDLMGEVTIAWEDVTSIVTDEPVNVVLPDGRTLTGRVATDEGKVRVATPAETAEAPLAQVTAVRNAAEQRAYERLLSPGILDLWAGYFDIGLATARGNAETLTLTTAFNATRVTNSDKTLAYFNQIYARAMIDGREAATAQAVRGGWAYNRNVSRRVFVNTFNDYEFDRFQSLDLRFVLGGGAGFMAIRNERTRLDLLGGAAYNRESFNTGLTRDSAEGYWGDDFTYKLSSITAVRQGFRMFNNLSNTGEYRVNFDLGAVTALRNWLAWQVTVSDRYLSNPIIGRKNNDILLSTGLRLSFAR